LIPSPGTELDYDESEANAKEIENQLESLLEEYRKKLKCSELVFKDTNRGIYLIEAPSNLKVPKSWTKKPGTSKLNRYHTPELEVLIRKLLEAHETQKKLVKSISLRFYKRMDENYAEWQAIISAVANLDALISLALSSVAIEKPSCRPTFLDSDRTTINFENLRHPCLIAHTSNFVPNDISMGGPNPNMLLLTGANMAGKSTILRQTCIAVIMAQLGCYVPAQTARLTPIDRIMSRIGASDNIIAASFTFMVELSETKKILTESTPRSLVILDELGRGTSTHDGMAVAYSVLHHLATYVGCVGFFVTHYGNLCADFTHHPEIAQKCMAVMTEPDERKVTFLYKLGNGAATYSYGLNVASMAKLPHEVIRCAEEIAHDFEIQQLSRDDSKNHKAKVSLGVQSDFAWMYRMLQTTFDSAEKLEDTDTTRRLRSVMSTVRNVT